MRERLTQNHLYFHYRKILNHFLMKMRKIEEEFVKIRSLIVKVNSILDTLTKSVSIV